MHATVLCELIPSEQIPHFAVLDRIEISLLCNSRLERARGSKQIVAHYIGAWPAKSKFLYGCEALGSEAIYVASEPDNLHAEHFIDLLRHDGVNQVTLIGIIDERWLQDTMKHANGYGVDLEVDDVALIVVGSKQIRKVG